MRPWALSRTSQVSVPVSGAPLSGCPFSPVCGTSCLLRPVSAERSLDAARTYGAGPLVWRPSPVPVVRVSVGSGPHLAGPCPCLGGTLPGLPVLAGSDLLSPSSGPGGAVARRLPHLRCPSPRVGTVSRSGGLVVRHVAWSLWPVASPGRCASAAPSESPGPAAAVSAGALCAPPLPLSPPHARFPRSPSLSSLPSDALPMPLTLSTLLRSLDSACAPSRARSLSRSSVPSHLLGGRESSKPRAGLSFTSPLMRSCCRYSRVNIRCAWRAGCDVRCTALQRPSQPPGLKRKS